MRCAVVGDPVGHSLSPVLHRAAYEELGLDWTYDAVQVRSGGLAGFLDGLDDSWRGLSLTMPLKREVVPLLTSAEDLVRRTGVANTVVLGPERARHGLNTDVPGAVDALRAKVSQPLRRAVVLGAGATAASVLFALAELGLEHATVLARSPERAGGTLAAAATRLPGAEVAFASLAEASATVLDADVVVSTVPASVQTPELVAAVVGVPVVFDVVYEPWPTPLAASAGGRVLVDGLDLLVGQAVHQVRAMTGREDVLVPAMREAGERVLRGRGSR